ncbi:MAG: MFS transporter [Huintestinicola sp.]
MKKEKKKNSQTRTSDIAEKTEAAPDKMAPEASGPAEAAPEQVKEKKHRSGKNTIFVYFIVMFALICLLISVSDTLDSSALKPSIEMSSMSLCSLGTDGNRYVIADGGMSVIVTDPDMNYLFKITGGVVEGGFYYAYGVTSDGQYIYIRDYVVPGSGNGYDEGARISRYSYDGAFIDYIYANPDVDIYSMEVADSGLYFALLGDYSVGICNISPDGVIISENYIDTPFEYIEIADISAYISENDEKLCLVLRTGDVYEYINGELQQIYAASEAETEKYFSLPYEAEYDSTGRLYINDYGCRNIFTIENGTPIVAINSQDYSVDKDMQKDFSLLPLINGMEISPDDQMSFITTEYVYNSSIGDYEYSYNIVILDKDGNMVFNDLCAEKTPLYKARTWCAMICIAVIAVMTVIAIVKFAFVLKTAVVQSGQKIQLLIMLTAFAVTAFVSAVVFSSYNTRYFNEVLNKMSNICLIFTQNLNIEDVEALDSPASYLSDEYNNISDTIGNIIYDDINTDTGIYCVMYKVIDGIVSEVYSGTDYHGGFYPMSGGYENSIEQHIYETGEPYRSYSSSSSAGSYMFVLYPIFNSDGEVIALLETGTDLYAFSVQNNDLIRNLVVYVFIAIITALLIINELVNTNEGFRLKRKCLQEKVRLDPTLIRPAVFLVFFAANISTAFLPIYGTQLWDESFPMPMEVAAAIPLSAETLFAAVTAFAAGFIADRVSPKILCCASTLFYFTGNVLSAYAGNLYMLTAAGCITGIAGGVFSIAVNTYIASFTNEDVRSKGFVSFNAAFLAGVNCGTVIGSVLAEKFGYSVPYLVAAIILIPALLFIIGSMSSEKQISSTEKSEKSVISFFRFIFSPRIISFFLFIVFPYVICASFLSYFFPIFGEDSGLTESHISFAFLVSGIISIYVGPTIAELASKKLGVKRSMILASVIYAAGLIFFIISPTIIGCFIVIAMFAFADGIGLTTQSVYYSGLPEVERLGSGKAMSIETTIENISSTCGPIIFGFVLMLGPQTGMSIIGGTFAALLILFVITAAVTERKNAGKAGKEEA